MIDTSYGQSNRGYNQFLGTANRGLTQAVDNAIPLREEILRRYSGAAENGLLGLKRDANGFFSLPSGVGGGGGVNFGAIGDYASARNTFQDLANTGGNFGDALGHMQRFASTGGVANPDAIRYRATSQIPSFYQALQNQAARRRAVQGGYSPAFDESMAEMARQAGRESYDASRKAEADLADLTMRGQQFGAQGLAEIANQMAGNRLSGAQGLFGIGRAEQDAMTTNAQLADAAAGRNLDFQSRMMGLDQEGRLNAIGGLADLYRSAPGEVGQYLDAVLGGLGGQNNANQGYLGLRAQNNPRRDWLGTGMQLLGAAGGFMSGLGGLGFRPGGVINPGRYLPGWQTNFPRVYP